MADNLAFKERPYFLKDEYKYTVNIEFSCWVSFEVIFRRQTEHLNKRGNFRQQNSSFVTSFCLKMFYRQSRLWYLYDLRYVFSALGEKLHQKKITRLVSEAFYRLTEGLLLFNNINCLAQREMYWNYSDIKELLQTKIDLRSEGHPGPFQCHVQVWQSSLLWFICSLAESIASTVGSLLVFIAFMDLSIYKKRTHYYGIILNEVVS